MINQCIEISSSTGRKEINLLFVLYNRAIDLPCLIKRKICDDLGWSEAKFYRRIRSTTDDNRLVKSLSKMEKRTIIEIFKNEYESNMQQLLIADQSQQKYI